MKKYNIFGAVTLLILTACKTNAELFPVWSEDGVVSNAEGKQIRLKVQGIYDALNYAGHTYLAGFKIDKDGTNYPYIAKISSDLSVVKYWSFETIPNDIFIYQQEIHSVSTDGKVSKLVKNDWRLTELTFPPDSQVIYSDNNTNLIVCYPASLAKAVVRPSGCKSLNNHWQLDFVWRHNVPKMCNGILYAIEQKKNSNTFKKIDITTGKEISSSKLKKVPEDICSL
jgi:hypothetical protein